MSHSGNYDDSESEIQRNDIILVSYNRWFKNLCIEISYNLIQISKSRFRACFILTIILRTSKTYYMMIKYKQTTQKDREKNGTEIFPSFSYSHKIMNHNFIEYFETKRAPQLP